MDRLVPDPRGYWRHHSPDIAPLSKDISAERARWQRILASYLPPQQLEAATAEVRAAAEREQRSPHQP